MPYSLDYQRMVIAYHGCDQKTAKAVLLGTDELNPSMEVWDWLGHGIYFWEHGPERALDWAKNHLKIKKPAVVGAYINLGSCFDLLDVRHTRQLKSAYKGLKANAAALGHEMPKNLPGYEGDKDAVRRELDCAVINFWMSQGDEAIGDFAFQTVRGAFTEGKTAYPGARIMEKTHIQIAVRDPSCILGYFRPKLS